MERFITKILISGYVRYIFIAFLLCVFRSIFFSIMTNFDLKILLLLFMHSIHFLCIFFFESMHVFIDFSYFYIFFSWILAVFSCFCGYFLFSRLLFLNDFCIFSVDHLFFGHFFVSFIWFFIFFICVVCFFYPDCVFLHFWRFSGDFEAILRLFSLIFAPNLRFFQNSGDFLIFLLSIVRNIYEL